MNLYGILTAEDVVGAINNNLDYLIELIPEIKYMINFDHKNPGHHLDVWNHTLLALSKSPNNFEIRLVLLLHDIGKPFKYEEKDGVRHYRGHPDVSAKMAYDILKRLNYDESFIKRICFFIKNHDYPISNTLINDNYEDALLLFEVQKCDALAHNPEKLERKYKYINEMNNILNIR